MTGNFQFGLVSGQNQNIAALANVNIDFSIVKCAAPPEYNELGLAISPKRRTEAEDGPVHTVARKLALLLCDDLPEIPDLVKAYGIRASEIAKNPKVNPKGTSSDGAFREHIGIDGTSLWAAATSGKGAVAVHLLACMLSRMWKGRATAVWAEMVSRRKAMLKQRLAEDIFSLDDFTASTIQISRDQLAEWDASARAWLESADTAFSRKQAQARIIIDNLGIELPSGSDVYKIIMKSWKEALRFMENIVNGMPQAVETGEILLALSSWHLYPDLEVLCAVTRLSSKMIH
ncbi:hypothetical protein AOQ84DRAFT_397688 [Glonium stellatum]|uniref:Uncharacterized protein n=1 Tax=Glonium stellatum TaxID=574774 RepID=A0A8E2F1I4_9PEZI|nr:hypothetical protein AOQ84DRAFT_397688 [Glonium stellatum]